MLPFSDGRRRPLLDDPLEGQVELLRDVPPGQDLSRLDAGQLPDANAGPLGHFPLADAEDYAEELDREHLAVMCQIRDHRSIPQKKSGPHREDQSR